MTRYQTWRATHTLACLAVSVVWSAVSSQAATAAQPRVGQGLAFVYAPSKEITLVGTVKGLVSPPIPVKPFGLHLLINSGGKVVDAHLGPYLPNEDRAGLQVGQLVQIVGAEENIHGKKVLLARQLIFNGRLVNVRNGRGFLIRSSSLSQKTCKSALALSKGETK